MVTTGWLLIGPDQGRPTDETGRESATPSFLDQVDDAVAVIEFGDRVLPEGWLGHIFGSILAPPSPASGDTLPTWRDRSWRMVFMGRNAPPRDSLEKVLSQTELDEFRQLPALVAAEAWRGEIDRQWLGPPAPAEVTRYEEAADLIEQGRRRPARNLISGLARDGDANALYLLALAHIDNPVSSRITNLVVNPMMKAAEKGHADAALRLGHYARFGLAVDRDPRAARSWYETALGRGSARAATALGDLLLAGDGGEPDPVGVMAYYEEAAARGDIDAMTKLGIHNIEGTAGYPDYISAKPWFQRAARAGDRLAQWYLAAVYARDDAESVVDREAFLAWASKSAQQGQADAMLMLGRYHLSAGDGSPSAESAVALIRGAALRSNAQAQFSYAELLQQGIGTEPDPVKALMFYRLALRNGYQPAKEPIYELLPGLTCDQFAAATNAYLAFYKITRLTPELKTGGAEQRRTEPGLALGTLTGCVIPKGPRPIEIEEFQLPAFFRS